MFLALQTAVLLLKAMKGNKFEWIWMWLVNYVLSGGNWEALVNVWQRGAPWHVGEAPSCQCVCVCLKCGWHLMKWKGFIVSMCVCVCVRAGTWQKETKLANVQRECVWSIILVTSVIFQSCRDNSVWQVSRWSLVIAECVCVCVCVWASVCQTHMVL